MPGLNRKGPEGQGPKTGRGMGRCNPDFNEENFPQQGLGRRNGRGRGRGNGRGMRRRFEDKA